MKKLISIITSLIILMAISTSSFAAEAKVTLEGKETIKAKETNTLTVKISTKDDVQIVIGRIEKSSNVTNMKVTEVNGWGLEYNEANGKFVLDGSTEESKEVLKIEYTVEEGEEATISLKELDIATYEEEEIEIAEVSKNIKIEKEEEKQEEPKQEEPSKEEPKKEETSKEEPKQEEPKIIEEENKGEKETKEEIKTEEPTTNNNNKKTETDKTEANNKLPATGAITIKVVATILAVSVLATGALVVLYKRNRI